MEAPERRVAIEIVAEFTMLAGSMDIDEIQPFGAGASAIMVDLGPAQRAPAIVIDAEVLVGPWKGVWRGSGSGHV